MSEDLFDGRPDPEGSATGLKLEEPGAVIQLKVTDISAEFDTDYGAGFIVKGDLEVKRGEVSGEPEVGEEASYFVPTKTQQGAKHHIFEELEQALKRVQARELSVGDSVAVKYVEARPSKRKGYSAFKKHAVVVKRGSVELKFETGQDSEAPF